MFVISFSSGMHPVYPALRIFNWLMTMGELASESIETQPDIDKTAARTLIRIMHVFLDRR